MKNVKMYRRFRGLILTLVLLISTSLLAQQYKLENKASSLIVAGTSSLHDWEVTAEQQSGLISLNSAESILDQLEVSVVSESLKSGKSGMDKNTYKALKTKKYKDIKFKLTEVISAKASGNYYKMKVKGDLTITGKTVNTPIEFTLIKQNNKIILKGQKAIKMTSFGIDPPKALMGTIKTGDDLTIEFNTEFK